MRRQQGRAATLTALAVAALAFPTSAHGGSADNDPGIHVKRVETPNYVLRPDPATVTLRLANDGPASSRNVTATFTLTPVVGRQRPSQTKTVRIGDLPPDTGPIAERVDFEDVPIGHYRARVCARAKHRKRRVIDCKNGKDFSVIPLSLQGSATVTAPLFNEPGTQATQGSTSGAGTAFFFERRVGHEFFYGALGTVTFYVDGTDPNGCVWSGSTTVTDLSIDKLALSEELIGYRFVPQTSFVPYAATADCPPPLQDSTTTVHSGPWVPGLPQIRSGRRPFTLSGSIPVIPEIPGGYTWSFSAG